MLTSMGAGSLSAIVGCEFYLAQYLQPYSSYILAFLGNPLFLVKTRMQAYSPVLPVGAQRYYRHAWDAFSTIVREEGMKGLLRGWDAAILRGAIGGSVRFREVTCGPPARSTDLSAIRGPRRSNCQVIYGARTSSCAMG